MPIEEIAVRGSVGGDKLGRKEMEWLIPDRSVRLRFHDERKRHQRDRREGNNPGRCSSLRGHIPLA